MIQKIKGVADLFEPESTAFTRMEAVAREVFARYGYRELRLPVIERTELFARTIGAETDVVQKEMYTFPDRKGRSLTLRPEATAGVLRAVIENGLLKDRGALKLYAFGPMFRYERPQKGRLRQFHQIDAELLGPASPEADAEVLFMLVGYLKALGLSALSVELNSLGCAGCRPNYREALAGFLGSVDQARLCADCLRRSKTNPLRVLDCKVEGCKEAVAAAPLVTDSLCPSCRAHFTALTALLDAGGVSYALAPRLVRGLDYYVGTTFEVTSADVGAQSAVAGGGRYDGLIRDLGGPDVAGIGFAVGMDRLALLLPLAEPPKPDFHVVVLGPEASAPALRLAEGLRGLGLSGEADYEPGSMKSRLRAVNRSGARFALLLGPAEVASGQAVVKDMATGNQIALPLGNVAAIADYLRAGKDEQHD